MWIQISAGKGPDECTLAVGRFLNVLLTECCEKAIEADLIHQYPASMSVM